MDDCTTRDALYLKRHHHLRHHVGIWKLKDTAYPNLSISTQVYSVLGLFAGTVCSAMDTVLAGGSARFASVLTTG